MFTTLSIHLLGIELLDDEDIMSQSSRISNEKNLNLTCSNAMLS